MEEEILADLRFSPSQVIRSAGITARKLWYWVDQGFIQAHGSGKNTYFDYRQLAKARLIKDKMDQGYRLREAVRLAEEELRSYPVPRRRHRPLPATANGGSEPPSILLVDDNPDFLEVLEAFFRKKGYRVQTARNGIEALREFKRRPADVVVLDLKMPELDGIGTLRALRTLNPLAEIIVLTGYGTKDAAIESLRFRAYDFLEKPLRHLEELNSVVERALAARSVFLSSSNLIEQLSEKIAHSFELLHELKRQHRNLEAQKLPHSKKPGARSRNPE